MKSSAKSSSGIIARYALSRIYQQALGIITAFISPKILSSSDFGIWTLLKIIPRYGFYSHLGTGTSMRYLVPYYHEKDDEAKARLAEQTTFSTGFGVNIAFGLAFLIFALTANLGKELRYGLLSMSVFLLLQFVHEYYLVYLKAHERFDIVTATNYVFITCNFLCLIPLLIWLHLYGLYISIILAEISALVYLISRLGFVTAFGWSRGMMRELLSKGMPIMLLNFSVALISTVDRMVVSRFLGIAELGHYGVAILAAGSLLNIPGAAREVMEPHVMRSVDSMASKNLLSKYLLQPLLQTAWQMPLLIGPAALLLPAAIYYLLPKHVAAILPGQILLCGVFFLAMVYVTRMVIVAKNWEMASLLTAPLAIAANIGFGILLIRMGYGLVGSAVASSFSYLLMFMFIIVFLARRFQSDGKAFWQQMPAMLLPFVITCIFIGGASWFSARVFPFYWLRAITATIVFFVIYFASHALAGRILALPELLPWRSIKRRLPRFGRSPSPEPEQVREAL